MNNVLWGNKLDTLLNNKQWSSKMSNLEIVPNWSNITNLETPQIIEVDKADKPVITNTFDNDLDPFLEIEKVPLKTDLGGGSSAHSVRMVLNGKDTEVGVVGANYLCVPNSKIAEVGSEIRSRSGMKWTESKVFFDGKVYRRTFVCDDGGLQTSVPVVGDIVALVMEEVNSYDSSLKAGIICYFMRLVCLNGMRSKAHQIGYEFRHSLNNINWENEIHQSVVQLTGHNPQLKLNMFSEACGKLQKPIDFQELKVLSKNPDYLGKLPTQQYGQIVRNMLVSQNYPQSGSEFTAWDLLNSGTEILWHQKKITQGAIKNNALVVDGILQYGKDTYDEPFVDPNQTDMFQS